MSQISTFGFPTPIHFGVDSRLQAPLHLKEQGLKKVFLVTDRGIAGLPWFGGYVEEFKKTGLSVEIFSDIYGNPVKSQVQRGNDLYKRAGSDCIVGLGGGAALDVAKAIALMVNHPGDLFDYEDGKVGALPIDKAIPYWIGLPTTAGTGSEVGRSSVISDDRTHVKKIFFHPKLLAKAVFADPFLTVGLSPEITAATGFDALTHLIESFLAKGYHPMADGIALEGIRMVEKNLVRCVEFARKKEGPTRSHLEARGEMLAASLMGAVAFQKGLGVTHSCAHALSTICDLHHGLANAIMLPYCMRFNRDAMSERFARLGTTVRVSDSPDAFIQWIIDFKKQVALPASLKDAGVSPDKLDALIEIAVLDGCHACNAKPVTKKDFETIFDHAFRGQVG